MTSLLLITMIFLPIFTQYSLASLKASRCASEAPVLGDAAAEVMYMSGPNLETPLDWEHATKRSRPKLHLTCMIVSLSTGEWQRNTRLSCMLVPTSKANLENIRSAICEPVFAEGCTGHLRVPGCYSVAIPSR